MEVVADPRCKLEDYLQCLERMEHLKSMKISYSSSYAEVMVHGMSRIDFDAAVITDWLLKSPHKHVFALMHFTWLNPHFTMDMYNKLQSKLTVLSRKRRTMALVNACRNSGIDALRAIRHASNLEDKRRVYAALVKSRPFPADAPVTRITCVNDLMQMPHPFDASPVFFALNRTYHQMHRPNPQNNWPLAYHQWHSVTNGDATAAELWDPSLPVKNIDWDQFFALEEVEFLDLYASRLPADRVDQWRSKYGDEHLQNCEFTDLDAWLKTCERGEIRGRRNMTWDQIAALLEANVSIWGCDINFIDMYIAAERNPRLAAVINRAMKCIRNVSLHFTIKNAGASQHRRIRIVGSHLRLELLWFGLHEHLREYRLMYKRAVRKNRKTLKRLGFPQELADHIATFTPIDWGRKLPNVKYTTFTL